MIEGKLRGELPRASDVKKSWRYVPTIVRVYYGTVDRIQLSDQWFRESRAQAAFGLEMWTDAPGDCVVEERRCMGLMMSFAPIRYRFSNTKYL